MIRRRLSTGALRAAPSAASIVPVPLARALVDAAPQRGLASAVLLNSNRNWKSETVATIKAELKRRGLSQTGNKATLVSRISSAEASAFLPPVPPVPSALLQTRPRALSTTPRALAGKQADAAAPVASTGPQISSQRTEAAKPEPIKPEDLSVAPGLPASKDAGKGVGEKLDVKLPSPKAEEEADQEIPTLPDNFSASSPAEPEPAPSGSAAPKVMTVASAATHPAGGPVHGVHAASDAHTTETAEPDAHADADADAALVPNDAFRLGPVLSSLLAGPTAAWRTLAGAVPSVSAPEAKDGEAEYKKEDRPLDANERTGLYILGGIVASAFLLGGAPKSRGHDHEHAHGHAHAAAAADDKNKGDATWEKASGAGVVGHGARKD
ncbi:hypothetical protein Q5752_002381 [Cryptotrichosporon argae]